MGAICVWSIFKLFGNSYDSSTWMNASICNIYYSLLSIGKSKFCRFQSRTMASHFVRYGYFETIVVSVFFGPTFNRRSLYLGAIFGDFCLFFHLADRFLMATQKLPFIISSFQFHCMQNSKQIPCTHTVAPRERGSKNKCIYELCVLTRRNTFYVK